MKKSIFIIFLVLLHMSFSGNSQDYNLSNVTVSPNDKFTITTSPDCNGLGNGSITIDYNGTFSNLNLPISIELSNIFEDSSNPYYMDTDPFTIENLAAGFYILEIFFSPECKYLGIIQIEARNCKCDEKIVIENIEHLVCGNTMASIDVHIPSISDSEIVYNWYFFNDNFQEWELYCPNCGDKMTGIKKGLWKVEALYYNCVNSLNFTILDDEDISKLKFSYDIVIPVSSCTPNPYVYDGYYTSSDDGAVCINVTPKIPEGGKIKWSNGEYGTCNYNLGARTYTVYLEISGCEIELGKVELCCCYNTTDYPNHPNIPFCTESEDGNPVPIEMTSVVKSSYNNDGSIKLTITPNSACDFKWSPPKGDKSFIEGLSPGTYCVSVTTECSDYTLTDCFKVGDCNNIGIDFYGVEAACPHKNDGFIYVKMTNRENGGDYTFKWSNGIINNSAYPTDNINNLSEGIYSVTITDNIEGCVISGKETVPRAGVGAIPVDDPSCGYIPTCKGEKSGEFEPVDLKYYPDLWDCRIVKVYCPATGKLVNTEYHEYEFVDIDYNQCILTMKCPKSNEEVFFHGDKIDPYYYWENGECYLVDGCKFLIDEFDRKYLRFRLDKKENCDEYEPPYDPECDIICTNFNDCQFKVTCPGYSFALFGTKIEPYYLWKDDKCYLVKGCYLEWDRSSDGFGFLFETLVEVYLEEVDCNGKLRGLVGSDDNLDHIFTHNDSIIIDTKNVINSQKNEVSEDNISIFPNPLKNFVSIDFCRNSHVYSDVYVYNVLGIKVYEKKLKIEDKKVDLELNAIASGIYYIVLKNFNGNFNTYKIVKTE